MFVGPLSRQDYSWLCVRRGWIAGCASHLGLLFSPDFFLWCRTNACICAFKRRGQGCGNSGSRQGCMRKKDSVDSRSMATFEGSENGSGANNFGGQNEVLEKD